MPSPKLTIKTRLIFLAALNFIILGVVVFLFTMTIQTLNKQVNTIGQTQIPAIRAMGLTDMIHDGLRATVFRAFMAFHENDAQELDEAEKECVEFSAEIAEHLQKLKGLDVSPETKAEVGKALESVTSYVRDANGLIAHLKGGQKDEALIAKTKFEQSFSELEEILGSLGEKIEMETAHSIAVSSSNATRIGLIVAAAGAFLSLLLPFLLGRSLIRTLTRIVNRLEEQKSALENNTLSIDRSAQSVSDAADEQASAIEETASALEEINSMVSRTAMNATRLAGSSTESEVAVQNGRVGIARMMEEMSHISEGNSQVVVSVEESYSKIQEIVTMIRDIEEKTKVINDIVFQTKLLSFNASVEAARAGEHGKGFSVVAEEVGVLAEMSGKSAKEISSVLQGSVDRVAHIVSSSRESVTRLMADNKRKVETGLHVARECNEAFALVSSQVSEVKSLSSDISNAISEQTRGLSEINKAINLFNKSTQDNAASARESSDVANQLRTQFESLDSLMEELVGLVRSGSR